MTTLSLARSGTRVAVWEPHPSAVPRVAAPAALPADQCSLNTDDWNTWIPLHVQGFDNGTGFNQTTCALTNHKANTDIRHIGLMAQDFHAAFGGLGVGDKHISTVDADGVAFAAIQGLYRKVKTLEAENAGFATKEIAPDSGGYLYTFVVPTQLGPLSIGIELAGEVRISWSGPGQLQSRQSLTTGAWQEVPNAASPFTVQPTNSQSYFRLAQ